MQALFNQVVANHDSLTSAMVRSTIDPPNISPVELLIYVLESPLESLVGPHFGNTFGGPGVGGTTGRDSNSPIVGSEVYVSFQSIPRQLADLIFHEAMHNKLRWSDQQLQEWLAFLRKIEREVSPELDIHIICDNYATHKHPKVIAWIKRHPRFHLHLTPTSSSWLNLVERFFGEITRKVIRSGSFRSVGALVADILRFLDHHNLNPKPYRWTANPHRVLEKIDSAWEAILEEIYNPIYGTTH